MKKSDSRRGDNKGNEAKPEAGAKRKRGASLEDAGASEASAAQPEAGAKRKRGASREVAGVSEASAAKPEAGAKRKRGAQREDAGVSEASAAKPEAGAKRKRGAQREDAGVSEASAAKPEAGAKRKRGASREDAGVSEASVAQPEAKAKRKRGASREVAGVSEASAAKSEAKAKRKRGASREDAGVSEASAAKPEAGAKRKRGASREDAGVNEASATKPMLQVKADKPPAAMVTGENRLFADRILGKYGFFRNAFMGRLELVFRMGEDQAENQDDEAFGWTSLEAQVRTLQSEQAGLLASKRFLLDQLAKMSGRGMKHAAGPGPQARETTARKAAQANLTGSERSAKGKRSPLELSLEQEQKFRHVHQRNESSAHNSTVEKPSDRLLSSDTGNTTAREAGRERKGRLDDQHAFSNLAGALVDDSRLGPKELASARTNPEIRKDGIAPEWANARDHDPSYRTIQDVLPIVRHFRKRRSEEANGMFELPNRSVQAEGAAKRRSSKRSGQAAASVPSEALEASSLQSQNSDSGVMLPHKAVPKSSKRFFKKRDAILAFAKASLPQLPGSPSISEDPMDFGVPQYPQLRDLALAHRRLREVPAAIDAAGRLPEAGETGTGQENTDLRTTRSVIGKPVVKAEPKPVAGRSTINGEAAVSRQYAMGGMDAAHSPVTWASIRLQLRQDRLREKGIEKVNTFAENKQPALRSTAADPTTTDRLAVKRSSQGGESDGSSVHKPAFPSTQAADSDKRFETRASNSKQLSDSAGRTGEITASNQMAAEHSARPAFEPLNGETWSSLSDKETDEPNLIRNATRKRVASHKAISETEKQKPFLLYVAERSLHTADTRVKGMASPLLGPKHWNERFDGSSEAQSFLQPSRLTAPSMFLGRAGRRQNATRQEQSESASAYVARNPADEWLQSSSPMGSKESFVRTIASRFAEPSLEMPSTRRPANGKDRFATGDYESEHGHGASGRFAPAVNPLGKASGNVRSGDSRDEAGKRTSFGFFSSNEGRENVPRQTAAAFSRSAPLWRKSFVGEPSGESGPNVQDRFRGMQIPGFPAKVVKRGFPTLIMQAVQRKSGASDTGDGELGWTSIPFAQLSQTQAEGSRILVQQAQASPAETIVIRSGTTVLPSNVGGLARVAQAFAGASESKEAERPAYNPSLVQGTRTAVLREDAVKPVHGRRAASKGNATLTEQEEAGRWHDGERASYPGNARLRTMQQSVSSTGSLLRRGHDRKTEAFLVSQKYAGKLQAEANGKASDPAYSRASLYTPAAKRISNGIVQREIERDGQAFSGSGFPMKATATVISRNENYAEIGAQRLARRTAVQMAVDGTAEISSGSEAFAGERSGRTIGRLPARRSAVQSALPNVQSSRTDNGGSEPIQDAAYTESAAVNVRAHAVQRLRSDRMPLIWNERSKRFETVGADREFEEKQSFGTLSGSATAVRAGTLVTGSLGDPTAQMRFADTISGKLGEDEGRARAAKGSARQLTRFRVSGLGVANAGLPQEAPRASARLRTASSAANGPAAAAQAAGPAAALPAQRRASAPGAAAQTPARAAQAAAPAPPSAAARRAAAAPGPRLAAAQRRTAARAAQAPAAAEGPAQVAGPAAALPAQRRASAPAAAAQPPARAAQAAAPAPPSAAARRAEAPPGLRLAAAQRRTAARAAQAPAAAEGPAQAAGPAAAQPAQRRASAPGAAAQAPARAAQAAAPAPPSAAVRRAAAAPGLRLAAAQQRTADRAAQAPAAAEGPAQAAGPAAALPAQRRASAPGAVAQPPARAAHAAALARSSGGERSAAHTGTRVTARPAALKRPGPAGTAGEHTTEAAWPVQAPAQAKLPMTQLQADMSVSAAAGRTAAGEEPEWMAQPEVELAHKLPFMRQESSEDAAPQMRDFGDDDALQLDFLRQRVQAAVEEAAPVRIEHGSGLKEINIEQLQELIEQLPQFDVGRMTDKVYREIEKRLKFEQQRRGL
ncbi:cell envelope integrity protein TolA [Paenibacillus sp. MBLB4367]|uniref:cell envelope integrity protein TolA n=1 Tax=Paenibacillus sp. MBLB4367 TaxID=3384767 RepID=UPI003907FDB0